MVGLFALIDDHLFGNMEEDEECDHNHTLIDDSSAQGGDKENCNVGEDNSNMCNDVVIETELMQSHVEMVYMKMWSCKVSFDVPWMF